eukprot:5026781-Amphidinium_carterae.1
MQCLCVCEKQHAAAEVLACGGLVVVRDWVERQQCRGTLTAFLTSAVKRRIYSVRSPDIVTRLSEAFR